MRGGMCVCDASWGLAGLEGPQVLLNSLSLPRAILKLPGSSMLVPGMIQCTAVLLGTPLLCVTLLSSFKIS